MVFISQKLNQFKYFSLQLSQLNWHGKHVLDFGGNIGNMLLDRCSTLDEERYTCLDICSEAIEIGRRSFPKSKWYHYDRYCFFFNPYGVPGLILPELSQAYDYILAYSVFTNTSQADMFELVGSLEKLLVPGGKLAFTFIDPNYHSWPDRFSGSNLRWRLQKDNPNIEAGALLNKTKSLDWFILVNCKDIFVRDVDFERYSPEQQITHYVYYTEQYIKSVYPRAEILAPVNAEMQHCCIITRPG